MTTIEEKPVIDLNQFTGGTLERYRSGINPRVIYSEGVRYLAEKANAYWLIDAIASYLTPQELAEAAKQDPRISSMHFWKLEVADDQTAVLYAEADLGVPPFVMQKIPYTDFPLRSASIWAAQNVEHWVLYLPQEH